MFRSPTDFTVNSRGWLDGRYDKQVANYNEFLKTLKKGHKIVIIEIGSRCQLFSIIFPGTGAGTAVPTVRFETEKRAIQLGATIVRMNPDAPQIPTTKGGRFEALNPKDHFSFTHDSLAILELIDSLMSKDKKGSGDSAGGDAKAATAGSGGKAEKVSAGCL